MGRRKHTVHSVLAGIEVRAYSSQADKFAAIMELEVVSMMETLAYPE